MGISSKESLVNQAKPSGTKDDVTLIPGWCGQYQTDFLGRYGRECISENANAVG
jgi:hypothetical protein